MPLIERLPAPARRLPLPRGRFRYTVQRDIPVPMPDGVTLLADRYAPAGVPDAPTILVRTPYGRRGLPAVLAGLPLVPFGFQLLVQSVRGTFGSGGEFDPLGSEQADGLATVRWMRSQPWFTGSFATYGASYLGYSSWAIAAEAGPELKAISAQVTASSFRDAAYVGGSFALETVLTWSDLTFRQERPLGMVNGALLAKRRARRAARSGRPLAELDELATGAMVRFYQDLLANDEPGAEYWRSRDFTGTLDRVTAPVTLLGGWYDIFLPWQLKDYLALRAAGRRPYLTIGPWWHFDARHGIAALRESLAWFRAHLRGDFSRVRANPVRVYLTGAGQWRDYRDWPPPGMRPVRWHLHPGGGLGEDGPQPGEPSRYLFDPADPTPSLAGPSVLGSCKPVDQRPVEKRADVLVFTSAPLRADLDVIGPVEAELFVRSDREHTDFVVRLCDVAPDGTSLNLCEGARRLRPGDPAPGPDGVRRVRVELWPVGHRFRRGHRVRVHVASGAFPVVAVNPGTGEPLGSATARLVARQQVLHDPDHPSAIHLPVVERAAEHTVSDPAAEQV
ncbi:MULTISPECIES: CocE/NonD family hydrolase [Thermomonospora]|uniref:X-Pro dipeptidyl-peptidase domain protein n=1 Tax=Thermomonospora curvata (strain ATCC 19995 / DSM 43183 / JCM 3096 / KCTC 9072 / NBRC 15933 / NCIMB 10081 / Henssen B9) TaxID=471852 RepID=D1A728_THECD|nr:MULTISPECIES: CocE/NonD family hydrolase [Thermomonospora]ACY98432.1 X-Pro dipeptidyl-peptidase domain protein [Thermomonospora curvata DSM 43183]PKK13582.1 MAG: X-Pro dipeptidyl-peptidase [Thermomonospora sp. CIF 1]